MGTLRFILIMAVVFAHVGGRLGNVLIDSQAAVQAFFIISGYLITLILDKKYKEKGNYWKFLISRILRIFPIYWTILLAMVLLTLGSDIEYKGIQVFISFIQVMKLDSILISLATNIFILGQDILHFTGLTVYGGLKFITNPQIISGNYLGRNIILAPPSWAISIILMFYILAPFITKLSTKKIILIALGSFILRMLLYSKGLFFDPWSYRFFPTELLFFLFGMLSYKLTQAKAKASSKNTHYYLLGGIILFILLYRYLGKAELFHISIKQVILFGIIIYSLPSLASGFKNNKIDNKIGELAFPIYLIHLPILLTLSKIETLDKFSINSIAIIVIISSLVLSKVLLELVDKPIHKYRKKHFNAD